jgi:hypothetical protein
MLAQLLVRLHAPAWRQRYGEEFKSLLIDTPLTVANFLNAGESALESRRLTIMIPFVAIASLVALAFVFIPAHRPISPNPIQLAATKDPAYKLRVDHSIALRRSGPCRSLRERDDKACCA